MHILKNNRDWRMQDFDFKKELMHKMNIAKHWPTHKLIMFIRFLFWPLLHILSMHVATGILYNIFKFLSLPVAMQPC